MVTYDGRICPQCERRYFGPVEHCKACGYQLLSAESYERVALIVKNEVQRQINELKSSEYSRSRGRLRPSDLSWIGMIMIAIAVIAVILWLAIPRAEPAVAPATKIPPASRPRIQILKQRSNRVNASTAKGTTVTCKICGEFFETFSGNSEGLCLACSWQSGHKPASQPKPALPILKQSSKNVKTGAETN